MDDQTLQDAWMQYATGELLDALVKAGFSDDGWAPDDVVRAILEGVRAVAGVSFKRGWEAHTVHSVQL